MHYHHGVFRDDQLDAQAISEPDADAAMDRAVTGLLPFIPTHASVLDVGSGWCGPMRLLQEHEHEVTGITVSASQAAHCQAAGLKVLHADAERLLAQASAAADAGLGTSTFDVALLLESLSHIKDKQALFAALATRAHKLVLRANTYEGAEPSEAVFGDSMALPSTGA